MKALNILWLLFSFPLYSQTESMLLENAANKALKVQDNLQTMLTPLTSCQNTPEEPGLSCSSITDNFCSELWNEKNTGNMKVFDGMIMAGKAKSGRLLSEIENDKALINSLGNLPEDLREAMAPEISNLPKMLASENKSQSWSREYSRIKMALSNSIEDLADKRFEKENPPLKVDDFESFSPEKKIAYRKIQKNIQDEVTIAKYRKHENWKRVENVFPEVKENLVEYINSMKISSERKKILKEKLEKINLKLPLAGPEGMLAGPECGSSEVNAFYSPTTKNFTVCAGLFNTYQSESSLAFVIGHELSHAIDSENIANDDARRLSILAKRINPLAKKMTYDCNEWNKIQEEIKPKEDFELKNLDPLENLYTCLRGPQDLEPITKQNIVNASKMDAKNIMSYYATRENFSALVTAYQIVDRKKIPNPFYFNPSLLIDSQRGYSTPGEERDAEVFEIFNQNMLCELQKEKLTPENFEKVPKDLKASLFEKAMLKTAKIIEYSSEDAYKYCGKNCSQLTSAGMSVNPQEKVADWFSIKAYPAYLKKISPANRAQASALTTSLFCPEVEQNTEMSAVEKSFSLETHPDSRIRRVSVYTPEISKLIGCEADDKEKGYAQCEP